MEAPSAPPQRSGGGSVEISLLFLSFGVVLGYHAMYYFRIKREPGNTVFGFGNKVRGMWVEKIMSEPKNSILGVQTMRNELLVGQFLAQCSFVALSVVVGASTTTDLPSRLDALSAMDPLTGQDEPWVSPVLKLALLIALLAGVFLNCVQHLRLIKHVSMFVGCNTEEDKEKVTKTVSRMYNRSVVFFWVAMRLMLLLFPAVAWLFGPTYGFIAAVLAIVFMYCVDNLNMGEKKLHENVLRRTESGTIIVEKP
mmetsp:Transcript_3028/g.7558  ORF Transcript_3028/g.7558 Transcript_3028/m.7558 type:complete len:253 (+) Transcript_3028:183-941(+)